MILGISGSGRDIKITSKAVQLLLEATGKNYEFISLHNKNINGCIGCTKCAKDNICKQEDDWNKIGDKMLKAEAIVFGAPNYYGTINAHAHACLERTYAFRHREKFKLAGKLGISIGVDDSRENPVVTDFINKIFTSNNMALIDEIHINGYSQCYTCGYGKNCAAGNVVADHGFLENIEEYHLPDNFSEMENSLFQLKKAGKILGSIINNRERNN